LDKSCFINVEQLHQYNIDLDRLKPRCLKVMPFNARTVYAIV